MAYSEQRHNFCCR